MRYLFIMILFLGVFFSKAADSDTRLMRFPAINGDQVVFSYAGDLYTVDAEGGTARRLTSHAGYEMFPRFSPDGQWIAFTAQYDGNTEVYKIPAEGGRPERLTYTATLSRDDISDRMGPNNIVMGWTPDGKHIIYRSRRYSFNSFIGQLFLVPAEGGLSSQIPLSEGGFCSYDSSGEKLAFNKVFREFRTWKYYRGGMADDIWIYDKVNDTVSTITSSEHQDIIPMWHENTIYFLSDREWTMNLYAYDFEKDSVIKKTNFNDFDIKFPSLGEDRIIFEKGGFIYVYDIEQDKIKKLTINIPNDFLYSRATQIDASEDIMDASLSPNGTRIAISARGDVYSVPSDNGFTRNLTRSSGVHDRNASWSPNGKYIAYFSDKSGEDELYICDPKGENPPVQLTEGDEVYKFSLEWSPDSKKILWNDRDFNLKYVNIESKEVFLV
ncbi:MAG: S41 family peptidase, partial [Bacteroidota bacterium]